MLEKGLRILEYPVIINELAAHASTFLGKEKVEELQPIFDYHEVGYRQQSTWEATTVLRFAGEPPFGGIRDIRAAIKRAKIGGMLDPKELIDIATTLYGGRNLRGFLQRLLDEHDLPIIKGWIGRISSLQSLERAITTCIDEQGEVLDSASPALRQIRNQIRTGENRIREKLDQMTKSPAQQKMLQEGIVTIRNNRYCLPVKQEHRHYFGGIVHDQSASGATLFIEPEAVVSINNQIKEAKLQEEREIEKILIQLSTQVAEETEHVTENVHVLTELDFMFAKAHYAAGMKAVQPRLNQHGYFHLKKARHPLIASEEIVPISFELGAEYTSMVITGPNTGGKTVTLKTLGLLTLMTCSGLFIPAEEGSAIAVVSSVYADIGDEQSIEQSLSTFSGHMTTIVDILKNMDSKSLVLFDELGAGTDPTEGASLAMSILDEVRGLGARVVATTHYSELKAYAYNQAGVMNASVEFDVQTLRPTYRLLVGVPGRSNAFSIAERLGLPRSIIEKAQTRIGAGETRAESMIASLEENQKEAEQERRKAELLTQEVEQVRARLLHREEQFEKQKENRLAQIEKESNERMAIMMKEAESIIRDLRKKASQQEPIKDHLLIEAKKKLETVTELGQTSPPQKRKKRSKEEFKPGEEVHVHSFGQKGYIVEKISNQEYFVQLGVMKMKIKKDQMEKVRTKPAYSAQNIPRSTLKKTSEPMRMELDLRGKRVDDAILEMDKYLDDALLSGYPQVYIIHGKGTGQLRQGVQDFLKQHKHVNKTRLGGPGEGGSGVTVVELK